MASDRAAVVASTPSKFSMFISRIAILFLLLQARNVAGQDIRIDKNEVSLKTGSTFQQITQDGTPKRLPSISPDGKRIVYVVDLWLTNGAHKNDSGDPEDVVEIDSHGKVLRHLIPEGYIPIQFERLEWIDNHRVGAMSCGHANCFYWVMDADTGKSLKKMEGGFDFVWSHNRNWVARRFIDSGGGDGVSPTESDGIMLNDDWIYPTRKERPEPAAGSKSHTIGESIVWSPHDAWVAFTDVQGPEGDNYVVLGSPAGVILRDTIASDVSSSAQIKWTDDTHLDVIVGERTFRLVVVGKELRDITPSQ